MTRVWAISDLHLTLARPESRERFAGRWRDHISRIEANWRESVARDDLVVLPGDVSMAHNHRELQPDLNWLERLPGRKVMSQGNHDGWWNKLSRIRPMLRRSQQAVGGDAVEAGGVIVCGTRGAEAVDDDATPEKRKQWRLEVESLGKALEAASALRKHDAPLVALWHYPPFDRHGSATEVVEMLAQARVTACVYGHVHQLSQWASAPSGTVDGVLYRCVAADAIGFRPLRIV